MMYLLHLVMSPLSVVEHFGCEGDAGGEERKGQVAAVRRRLGKC